mmetsp:Transcript_50451/g.151951  ORF Transcript_50451/g.151951 Transcript_50451/m.151951 type:complete len:227 (+) Transcript_50451:1917-2597(+)
MSSPSAKASFKLEDRSEATSEGLAVDSGTGFVFPSCIDPVLMPQQILLSTTHRAVSSITAAPMKAATVSVCCKAPGNLWIFLTMSSTTLPDNISEELILSTSHFHRQSFWSKYRKPPSWSDKRYCIVKNMFPPVRSYIRLESDMTVGAFICRTSPIISVMPDFFSGNTCTEVKCTESLSSKILSASVKSDLWLSPSSRSVMTRKSKEVSASEAREHKRSRVDASAH